MPSHSIPPGLRTQYRRSGHSLEANEYPLQRTAQAVRQTARANCLRRRANEVTDGGRLLAVYRKGVELVVSFADAQALVAGADVQHAIHHGRAAADRAAGVVLPKNLAGLRIIRANEVARRAGKDQPVVTRARYGDRAEVRLVIGTRSLPQNLPRRAVERRHGALLGMIRDRRVDALAVGRRAEL